MELESVIKIQDPAALLTSVFHVSILVSQNSGISDVFNPYNQKRVESYVPFQVY
jgi:hypothetical protein